MDCFASLATTALISNTRSRSRGAMRPSCAFISRPMEGVGNAGCPLHPRSRVHFVLVERTRATTSTPESPGIPARNGFNGLCRALVTGLFCHRRTARRYAIHRSRSSCRPAEDTCRPCAPRAPTTPSDRDRRPPSQIAERKTGVTFRR
jgi:hypothetical protein